MKQNKMRILTATLCLLFCMSLVGPLAAKHYGSHAFDESVSWADYDIMGARQVPFDAGYYNIIADVPHNDHGYSVVEVFNEFGVLDGYAIAGSSMNSNGDLDFLLIRTDVAGNEIWRQTYDYGDHSTNVAYDLVQCSDQGFALVGQTIDYSVNYGDCLLLRTYADGTLWWAQPLDNFGRNDVGYSLVELDSGGFAIAAATSDGPGSGGNWDGWLIITDAMGVI
ncbi:MAG: hypothetical protein EAX87_13240, partial [Candidatus Thorarchaeota archaeon]|nr:hypothetical protein [Candidatus Thorarchaeota archaeon]